MKKQILIDSHQIDETRVVLLNGDKIEEFDYENKDFLQLKSNVYLARVTRVEPSLQAAFVEYGGNRQGFLAFSEIHPDYYRIPIEDREALKINDYKSEKSELDENNEEVFEGNNNSSEEEPEIIGGEDFVNNNKTTANYLNRYKIQEVIVRKQILLVQVVKEERGNKGAAMTTFLSLPGRYCVFMPNSNRGGGISRKITNQVDRKRLKSIINEFNLSDGSAIIIRTAGSKRTKTEIKRDYTYLSNLWNEIRNKTLKSEAPSLIHEEGSLIKRTIRDIYTNDIDEIIIEGENGYKTAKDQMKMLIPSHIKKILKFNGSSHIFQFYNIESQLESIHQERIDLNSGSYLIINQTEALVAIDVNSGKSTKQRNIEETAYKTNIEAAEEIGRQLKLRDLSGLIVIDFIDMEETKNRITVEKKLKDSLRNDRARIQIGSISHFGLLEMSRQRMRPSLVESISQICHHCQGTGKIRTLNSLSLHFLRLIEDELAKTSSSQLTVILNSSLSSYILNEKRLSIIEIEKKHNVSISILSDDKFGNNDHKFIVNKNQLADYKTELNDNYNNNKNLDELNDNNKKRKRNKKPFRKKKKTALENKNNLDKNNKNEITNHIIKESSYKTKQKNSKENLFDKKNEKEFLDNNQSIEVSNDSNNSKIKKNQIINEQKKSKEAIVSKKKVTKKVNETKPKTPAQKNNTAKKKVISKDSTKNKISTPVNVVDVSKINPESKKKGWWSR